MRRVIKHNIVLVAILLIVCLFSFTTFSQKIVTQIDKDSIYIGELIHFIIEYPIENATSGLNFTEGDSLGNGFEVMEVYSKDTVNGNAKLAIGISTFELDNQFIPSFSVFYGERKLISKPIPVFVSLIDADTTQTFRDIKPIVKDPLTFKDKMKLVWDWAKNNWVILILILIGLIGLVFLLIYLKKQKKTIKEPVKVIIPAHITAKNKLKKLEEKELWQNNNQKQYNVELTGIIQEYITDRYKVSTSERTSSEIISSLKFVEMGEENQQNLRKLLMLSDLVKFAKEEPTAQENEQVLKDAYRFIETTKKTSN